MLGGKVLRNPGMNINKRALLLNIAVLITAVCFMFTAGCNKGEEASAKDSGKIAAAVTIVREGALAFASCLNQE